VELALATRRPSSSVISASTKTTRLPPETTLELQVNMPPGRAARRKLTFISALAVNTFLSRAQVTVAAPMAESQQAARNPPWMMPTGLVKRSSAGIVQVVRPGSDLSIQTMPRVRSQLGGTWTPGVGTSRRYRTNEMASAPATVVRAATVLTSTGPLSPAEVVVDQGLIVEIRGTDPSPAGADGPAPPAPYALLAPGFVDLQMNGIGAVDVAEADGDDWAVLDAALVAQGVTSWCPTLCSAPLREMEASLGRIRDAARRSGAGRPAMVGAHLEGPFLAVAGAHPPAYLQASVDRAWLTALAPDVALVTLAPELPGAIDAIEALVASGVLVSLGHSACTIEVAGQAASAGARLVTHLGNGMGPFRPREPGLLGAALADDRLAVSLIADLVHIHPALLTMAFRAKGADRSVLVTDAVATGTAAGAAAQTRTPANGGPPRRADGTLVGSVLPMNRAVAHCVAEAGISVVDAVAAASSTPARLLGLDDRGAIAVGRRADLVALDAGFAVQEVWIAGRPAFAQP
jgi:N-acetylglucosamine-6-phosphate deacetylase